MPDVLASKLYHRPTCAVFYRTTELWGGLSNMAGGYPLRVNGIDILTSEALYQACRYPHCPTVQAEILAQASPIAAKMKSKHHYPQTRPDWEVVRVPIMAWCLKVKLACHWESFSRLLLATGQRPIVEASARDDFWGALSVDSEWLRGANVLGCLLGALRERLRHEPLAFHRVAAPGVLQFCLLGEEIGEVESEAR